LLAINLGEAVMNNKIYYAIIVATTTLTLTTGPVFARGGDHPSLIDAPFDVVGDGYEVCARPEDYKVFIEEPTGNAFIRMPHGWKFIRKLDRTELETARAMWLGGVPEFFVGYEVPVGIDRDSNSRMISRE
jgi:hypothetical protein